MRRGGARTGRSARKGRCRYAGGMSARPRACRRRSRRASLVARRRHIVAVRGSLLTVVSTGFRFPLVVKTGTLPRNQLAVSAAGGASLISSRHGRAVPVRADMPMPHNTKTHRLPPVCFPIPYDRCRLKLPLVWTPSCTMMKAPGSISWTDCWRVSISYLLRHTHSTHTSSPV